MLKYRSSIWLLILLGKILFWGKTVMENYWIVPWNICNYKPKSLLFDDLHIKIVYHLQ